MPTKPKAIELRLNNANKWEMKIDGQWHGPPYPELQVPMNEYGAFAFSITGNERFAADAFVEKPGTTHKKADFADQFVVVPRSDKDLIVIDMNQKKGGGKYDGGKYEYMLQFAGTEVPPLDPIITNMGCCKFVSTGEIMWAFIGAGALALFLHAVRFWQDRRLSPASSTVGRNSDKS